jgi:hypothetical protein
MKGKDTSIKGETEDVVIPFPKELKGIIEDIVEFHRAADFEHFVVWMIREQANALLESNSEMGEMISEYLRQKHHFRRSDC